MVANNDNIFAINVGGSIAMGKPQNRWFIVENPIKKDDLGVPLFQETTTMIQNENDHINNYSYRYSL